MATTFYFNNKQITLPGVYSQIKSGINNPPLALDYGKVLVIDTGTGAGYGGGAGINGELSEKGDAVYVATSLREYQNFLKGGILWKTAEKLFKPDGAQQGASAVYHVKAATTTAATLTFTATGGGAAGGTFKLKVRDEGVAGNGVITGSGATGHLDFGYAYTVETGVIDTAKWIMKLWVGTWKGNHTDSIAYDEVAKADTKAQLLIQSPEFDNIQDLIDWALVDGQLNQYFSYDTTSAVVGAGTVDADDVTAVVGYNAASGGTESYSSTDLDTVFETLEEWDGSFILCDKYGKDDYDNALVGKIKTFIETDAKYQIGMVYGGGKDDTEFTATDGSIEQAEHFDSEYVTVVHGDSFMRSQATATGYRRWPSIYTAAAYLGRLAGKAPQVPATFKSIGIDKLAHDPTNKEKTQALAAGVLMLYNDIDFRKVTVLQAVNTLQRNSYLLNADGTTFSVQLFRIKAQLNKEITINAKVQLLGQEEGVNRNTLSPGYLKDWTETYLQGKVSNDKQDNLLVVGDNGEPAWQNVVVTRTDDSYFVEYEARGNSEITKLFVTGILID